MLSYIIRRLLIFIPTIFVLSLLVFVAIEAGPGDPASYMLDPDMPTDHLNRLREGLGLDRPLLARYATWIREFLRGNWGHSILDGASVKGLLLTRIPRTLYLMGLALTLAITFGVVFGVISALHQYSPMDNTLTFIGLFGISTPAFFTGLLGILFFSLRWDILPIGGMGTRPGLGEALRHMILPASVLAFRSGSEFMRYTRGAMLDALNKDYIALAQSKGLPVWRVTYVHGLRTALIPVVTIVVLRLPILVGGSVIVEQVFSWPGIGTMLITAARGQDFPVVMAVALLLGVALLFSSLLADILLAIIDPRVRLG